MLAERIIEESLQRNKTESSRNPFAAQLNRGAQKVLEWGRKQEIFIDNVCRMITEGLRKGAFSADFIASELHMSRRTFARKLNDHGVSYQYLLDLTRRKLALDYLLAGECHSQKIPQLLGYSDTRAFHRAFKRWLGCSPTKFYQTYQNLQANLPVTSQVA